MKCLLLFFCCFVCFVNGSLYCNDDENNMMICKKCIREISSEVVLPAYALYVIGFLLILMLVIIIWLSVMLYRSRLKEYKIFSPPAPNQLQPVATNPDLSRTFMTQTSHELTLLKMDSLPNITPTTKQIQDRSFENSHNSLTASSSSKDLKRNTVNRHTGLGKDFKVYRSVKKTTDQQLIAKEQMKKICDDFLARSHNGLTASLKDLNELLQEHKDEKPETGNEAVEKSASYPELDVYDNAPSNVPVSEMAGEAVYDCLPPSDLKNIIVEDYDTKYLLTISKENLTEPAYINARYRYNKL